MWNVSAVPLYIWCMLLLPSAVVAIYIAVRRRWACAPILFFSLTSAVASSAETVYRVFVLRRFDEKFRDAPNAAIEISLFGDALIGFIGLLLFGVTLAVSVRRGKQITASSIVVATFFGAIYLTLPDFLYWSHIQGLVLIQWIWILLVPETAALMTARQMVQGPTDRVALLW